MKKGNVNSRIILELMYRLLPIQIVLAAVSSINGIVSGYFAGNYVGIHAMSAVGLYSPISMLIGSLNFMISGGAAVICGKLLGQNEKDSFQRVFSLDLILTVLLSFLFTTFTVVVSLFGLTSLFTADPTLQPVFGRYLLGQAVGIIPNCLSGQLAVFLSMENRSKRTLTASIVCIFVNVLLNFLFVQILSLEELGLSLASSLSMWVYFMIQAQYFISKHSMLKYDFSVMEYTRIPLILKTGFPGAATYVYQTVRGLIVNHLLEVYTGAIGLSAFAASNTILGIFWSIPSGMNAVGRLLMSVSYGEEDKQSLTDIMANMFMFYLPLMLLIDIGIILCASPLTYLYFKDTASEVFAFTTQGLRILPLCMPFSIILLFFTSFGQISGKQAFINILSVLDGVVDVSVFSFLTMSFMGITSVYVANVFNGIVTTLAILIYAVYKNKHIPKNMEELMVFDKDFGVGKEERIDISVASIEEVVEIAKSVQNFCIEKGIDDRRSYFAALAMEEMAGNIVEHGFTKDNRKHSIDIRVVHVGSDIILRIRDDCIPFDPKERNKITAGDDLIKNIGIRMVYRIIKDITYQNLLGLNVLTIRI